MQENDETGEAEVAPAARAWPRFLDPRQASEYLAEVWSLSYSRATLSKLRCIGGGPRYLKPGHAIRYSPAELDRWARELIGEPLRSTSDGE